MAPNRQNRTKIAFNTINRSLTIVGEHQDKGASTDSIFIREQLPPLDSSLNPRHPPQPVEIINSDAFKAARNHLAADSDAKVSILNLASDLLPAGPWLHDMTTTQEEALCYSSTLYVTLKEEYYPWPNLGPGCVAGIYSPGVVVFKDDLDHDCVDLPLDERCIVSVITVAAPRGPRLTRDEKAFANASDLEDLREKIRLIYRIAAHNAQDHLVLGAMGCGAYHCPPTVVAEEMRDILLDQEFRGWFKKVQFAVFSRPGNGPGNFTIFQDVFQGVSA